MMLAFTLTILGGLAVAGTWLVETGRRRDDAAS